MALLVNCGRNEANAIALFRMISDQAKVAREFEFTLLRVANIELVDSPPRALHADGGAVEAENAVLGRVRRRGLNTITTRMRL
jgi:hypothetical protein